MRITQCYSSKSVHDFPFKDMFGLTDYIDSSRPCVFFGCYDETDLNVIINHNSLAVIWWCGQDALTFKDWKLLDKPNIKHVTERNNVKKYLDWILVQCELLPPSDMGLKGEARMLGPKIFAYAPKSFPQYHRIDIINNLRDKGYDIIVGDGSCNQAEWRAGKCDEYYSQCYLGLVLSPFAGGGASIIELGLRGIPCVTNVIDLPNTIKYETQKDVEETINLLVDTIGIVQHDLRNKVIKSLDYKHEFLNTELYERMS